MATASASTAASASVSDVKHASSPSPDTSLASASASSLMSTSPTDWKCGSDCSATKETGQVPRPPTPRWMSLIGCAMVREYTALPWFLFCCEGQVRGRRGLAASVLRNSPGPAKATV